MVRPLWFMSDMAEQYYLAWVSMFDSSYMRHPCLCTCEGVVSKAFLRGEG